MDDIKERKLKRGDTRCDGKRFWSYGPSYPNREYWIDADKYDGRVLDSNERSRESAGRHREHVRAKNREWGRKNRHKQRENNMIRLYGITATKYDDTLIAQGGTCAICKRAEARTRNGHIIHLVIDHDHFTGKTRGLLCESCNKALGFFRDSNKSLSSAISYLSYWQDKSEKPTQKQ